MRAIVGYTGFVGINLVQHGNFEMFYNSKNIREAFSTKPNILYFCGIPAAKYLANKDPEKDLNIVKEAMDNIDRIKPKSVVLISTVDVYRKPVGVDERTVIDETSLEPYGKHRSLLEKHITENYSDCLIVRLPGLFGEGLKKNFIYDMINIIPFSLTASKIAELDFSILRTFYFPSDSGFYQLKTINSEERLRLKEYFINTGFSAVNFTDSRSIFQFYNLKYLFLQIETARSFGIKTLNIATEPCKADELYKYIFNKEFINEISEKPVRYDMRTIFANELNGQNGYIQNKQFVLDELKDFVISRINLS